MASASSSSTTQAQYASAVNVSNFVSRKLYFGVSSDNYSTWKKQMLCLLESNNLVGFIDGEEAPPPAPEKGKMKSEDYVAWRMNDSLVKGWILGALSDELVEICVEFLSQEKEKVCDTARTVWLRLEEMDPSQRQPPTRPDNQEKDYYAYMELYKAALKGDWDTAQRILEEDRAAATARLLFTLETALHIAVGTGEKALDFVRNLVGMMTVEELVVVDRGGETALYTAALTGNTAAAKILVEKLPALLYQKNNKGYFPVHGAARSAHKKTLEYLIPRTMPHPSFVDSSRKLLLCLVIDADFYDTALFLVDGHPNIAKMVGPMLRLSYRDLAFPSGAQLSFWERLIYSSIGLLERESEAVPHSTEIVNPFPSTALVRGLRKWYKILVLKLQKSLLVVIDYLVPHGRRTHKKKLMHQQAIQLVKCLCMNMTSLTEAEATHIYLNAMMTAATLGIHEIIEEIVDTFPDAVYNKRNGHFFFQIAAKLKNEKVFNLIYQTRDHRHIYSDLRDSSRNTILHLVAGLSPQHKLNLVSGAALQMQRELQWFKQVEEFVHPYARKLENGDGKTPHMIFIEEHKSLKAEGEKWMKDTAQSYIIVAALIATVSFAAAITVPGGNNSNTGYPMFYRSNAFIVFAISVAATLFTSFTSLWMFLSIMTSRYAEEDFLYALPRGLCIGISTLSVSNMFMMVAFSASSYLVLGKEQKLVLLPVVVLACLPITAFVLLQFPLLIAVLSSTYGRGIFDKRTDHSPYY